MAATVPAREGADPAIPEARDQIAGLIFALLLIDAEGRIAEVNHAAESLLGTSANRLVGTLLSERIGPLEPRVEARLRQSDEALVARELAIVAGETDLRVNLTVSPLGNHPGWRVVSMSEVGREDAARKPGADTMLSAPAVLAHEIKNPLAAIRGAGQLVARKLAPEDRKLARMITDEVDRIARLIDRMQQLGSTRTGEAEACNPHEAIRGALATMRAACAGEDAASHEVEIREEFDPSLPPVLANRDALEQVLINLVSNARDAAREGQGGAAEIVVQTRFVGGLAFSAIRQGRAVPLPIEITVSDNGPGLPQDLRDHVFEPFVSSKPSGQGLGLALVRKLVRDMNGNISHERDHRTGFTHFRLHLPQAPRGS